MANKERNYVECTRFNPYESGALLGFATVRVGDLAFSGVRLFKSSKGDYFTRMPAEGPDRDHQYNTVWADTGDTEENKNLYDMISEAVLDFYQNEAKAGKPSGSRSSGNRRR